MTEVHRVGDLELEQDLQYQQQSWTVERVGWVAMSLIAIAALLGLTGSGWLSRGKVGQPNEPIWVEYERLGRFQSPEKLRIYINQTSSSNQIEIGMNRQYLEDMQIQQVTPEPARIEQSSDRLTYSFKGTTPGAITFYMQPEQVGLVKGSIELEGVQPLAFQQFIYRADRSASKGVDYGFCSLSDRYLWVFDDSISDFRTTSNCPNYDLRFCLVADHQ